MFIYAAVVNERMDPRADLLFEVSWEVCNKVGGIYTVVTSKAPSMQENYENYYLIGPYFPDKLRGIFEETPVPEQCKDCFERLKQVGIEVHTGQWLIKGTPKVMLVDYTDFQYKNNEIKTLLWERFKLDSLSTQYHDFDEPVVWAWAVGRVVEELTGIFNKKTVLHTHEWMSGAALLYCKDRNVPLGSVFTTHATMLGRTLATNKVDIYQLDSISPSEAQRHGPGLWAKVQMERICAREADVFTTVSAITGAEAEKFLGRKPDVIVTNGLDFAKFPTLDESAVRHRIFKQRIHTFLMYYFFPYYEFDLENTLIYFIAGRYEFHDKGIDVLIKSLSRLNERLKKEKTNKTIITFFWVPAGMKSIKSELLENRSHFFDIKDDIDDLGEELRNTLTYLLVSGKQISKENIFDKDLLQDLKVKIRRLKQSGKPPVATHDLYHEESDPILSMLGQEGLANDEDDPVKVVFYPIYLTGADGLLDLTYRESLNAGNLGIFPSFYEPWGYTPLETSALGVSAVTTDVAGFGSYVQDKAKGRFPGIFVIPRKQSEELAIQKLTDVMYDFAHLSKHERTENRISAKKLAETADWKHFVENYIKAHNLALERSNL
ncbi:hypothetical protein GF342_00075 [Candidatus Woesearchaeota archaeon]|nr:hypothetical protein [Candidatus Woesearchaeota archaeon]